MLTKMQKAQSTLEYALLIGVVIGALITIQAYIKRGLQGRYKSASDDIGSQYSPGLVEGIEGLHARETTTTKYYENLFDSVSSGRQVVATDHRIRSLSDEWWPSHGSIASRSRGGESDLVTPPGSTPGTPSPTPGPTPPPTPPPPGEQPPVEPEPGPPDEI